MRAYYLLKNRFIAKPYLALAIPLLAALLVLGIATYLAKNDENTLPEPTSAPTSQPYQFSQPDTGSSRP